MAIEKRIGSSIESLKAQGLVPMVTEDGLLIGNSGCVLNEYGMEWRSPEADACTVTYRNNKWMMIHDEGIPTMDADDCICEFGTSDQAIEAARNYLLGKPEVIGEWSVPTHKHPDWSKEKIEELVSHAGHFSEDTWNTKYKILQEQEGQLIEYYMSEEKKEDPGFDFAATQVIPVHHVANKNQMLYVRRDLQEAFIV